MNSAAIPNPALQGVQFVIGRWQTAGTHPYTPGVTLHGESVFEWIEGGAFLKMQTHLDDERFPAGIAIFGSDDATKQCFMLYFDERGVSRKYDVSVGDHEVSWSRITPEFSQRFAVAASPGGQGMVGKGTMSKDGGPWEADLSLEYTHLES